MTAARYIAGRALIALAVGCTSAWAAAPPMHFERLGMDAGLSEQAVNAIAQDPSGFLWVGTEDGLNRYDGFQFVHYTQNRARPGSLPNNYIADVRFGTQGEQWVATYGGVVRRMPGSGQFVPIVAGKSGSQDGLERARALATDASGRLWIGTRDSGLAVFDSTTGVLTRFRHIDGDPASLAADAIYSIISDRRGQIWVGSSGGVDILDPRGNRIRHYPLAAQISASAGERPQGMSVLEDSQGRIWIASESALLSYDPASGATARFVHGDREDSHALPGGIIQVLYEDRARRLWIGTADGLVRFDREHDEFTIYRSDPQDPESLPDNNIVSLFEDHSGLLWVGTKFGGLAKWNPRSWSFGLHPATDPGFASHNVMAFTEDAADRLWIGTIGGGLTAVGPDGGVKVTLRAGSSASALSEDRIATLATDRAGHIWAGTMTGGLDRIDPDSLAITHFRHDPADRHSLPADGVMSVLEDSAGRLWVGTFGGGLARLNTRTGEFQRFLAASSGSPRISSDRITTLVEDRRGRIWVGTDGGGIDILDPATDDLLVLRHDPENAHSLSSDTIYALYMDTDGSVWIGTRGGGLDHATLRDGQIQLSNLSEADGLPNNTVYGIEPDGNGRLWLSTNRGIACLEPRSGSVHNYAHHHGLQADEFNFGAHYRARDGRLLFGGPNGYNEFDPERLQSDSTPPPIALTSVLLMGQPLRADGVYESSRGMHFGYRQDVITFEYAALDFAVPQANLFEYRLAGFDRDWIRAGTHHGATYTNLPGGRYVLQVRAANADGVWAPHPLQIPITVDPPPWLTWWAYSLYALIAALLALAVWMRHRHALEAEAAQRRELERQVAERTHELADRNAALQRAYTKLEQVSFTDALTGLGNRRALDSAMPRLIEALRQNNGPGDPAALAVLLVDLDRLKPINDQFGHEAGDRLLLEVAQILKACVRDTDQVVRWGGDEFVIVHAVADLDGAAALAERLRFSVSKCLFKIGAHVPGRTSCSIGFALYPFVPEVYPHLGWERVLNVADSNLYRAKKTRNAWVGCCGRRHCIDIPDIETRAADDLESAEAEGYVDVRRSALAADETVSLLVRTAIPGGRPG